AGRSGGDHATRGASRPEAAEPRDVSSLSIPADLREVMRAMPVALAIAGSDPSGGAGIQGDLKTFEAHGVFGTTAITALTVQNTRGVTRVVAIDAALVIEQIDAVVSDLGPGATKIGMLANGDI